MRILVLKSKTKSKVPVSEKTTAAQKNTPAPTNIPSDDPVDQMIHELKDKDEIVRSSAASEHGHLKSEKSVEPHIRALKDSHVYVRHGVA
jgi:HEAT repeat protein